LGIDTGTIDPMQWRAMFGVDVEYIDQLEIIRRADLVLDQPVEDTVKWLSENVNRIDYDGNKLTPEKLAFQIRCYLATKEIIKEKELDFIAIQCMPDLSTHYVPQCISAAFLPGPYDAQGSKEPVAMACEADGDGALTMEILKQVSGGKPVLFGDLSYINESKSVIYIPNCGALCTWYAARSDHPNENLKNIQLRPAVRPGGGAITYFTAAPGPITLARLYRKAGKYFMVIISGEAIDLTPQDLNEFVQARDAHQLPTAFIKVNADINEILGTIGSNHISGVAGLYINEIVHFCELLEIEYKVFSEVGSQD
jgi:L-fucose isomerase